MQVAPVFAHVAMIRLGDCVDAGRIEQAPPADVVGMALGERDEPQSTGAGSREPRLDLGRLEVSAGVDQHVAVGRGDQVAVGDVLGHEDAVAHVDRILAALSLFDELVERWRHRRVTFQGWRLHNLTFVLYGRIVSVAMTTQRFDELVTRACERAGLDDFGDDSWQEGLRLLIQYLRVCAGCQPRRARIRIQPVR